MKIKFLLIFITIIFQKNIYSQEIPKEYKSANTMQITLPNSSEEILTEIGKSLVQYDFEIDKIDNKFFTISTKPILAKNILNYYIRAKVIDKKVEFQLYSSMDITINGINTSGYSLSNFKGQKGSANYEAISKLFLVVNNISPNIEYIKK